MNICKECGKGFCPSRARRNFGRLPKDICSPPCAKSAVVVDDKAELVAESICQALLQAGHIADYDCDTVNLIKPLLKPR